MDYNDEDSFFLRTLKIVYNVDPSMDDSRNHNNSQYQF